MTSRYDAIIVGGGVIGCGVALHLRQHFERVLLIEREPDLLRRASYANQARVHNGYHYPRSFLTALRSRVNFPRFVAEFSDCIDRGFEHYYAVARHFSNVTGYQFATFCRRVGAPVTAAPREARLLFDPALIDDVFLVEEFAFDAVKLAARFREALETRNVDLLPGSAAEVITARGDRLEVEVAGPAGRLQATARHVFNCTYSETNRLLEASALSLIPLKHELTELALVRVPSQLEGRAVTVMCGPFFSVMPFPALGLHSLSHVRYTPHGSWTDGTERRRGPTRSTPRRSNVDRMRRDASRYLPALAEATHVDSLWELKTVLPSSEIDDSRPILFRRDPRVRNVISIVGGKIDNIYDVFMELDALRAGGGLQ